MIWFLAVVMAFTPTYLVRFQILNTPTTLLEVLVWVFLITSLFSIKIKDLRRIKNLGAINYAIGLFVLAAVISTVISPDKIKALGQLKAFIIEPILVFYAIVLTVKTQRLAVVVRTLFFATLLISLFGILQYYSFIFLPIRFWGNGEELTRIVSVFEYPNALSLYLAPLIGFFSALWLTDYPLTKSRLLGAVGILIMLASLILTFSRGAWIATTIGILFVLLRLFDFKRVVLPLLLAGGLLLFLPGVRERLSLGLSDASSSAHFELLRIGANKAISSPILGNGLYGFRTTQQAANYQGEILNYPHNFILNFWLELGLLGLISFIWILILAFRRSASTFASISFAVTTYLIIFLVHGLVDVPYFKNDLSLMFWFIISLLYLKE